MGDSKELVCHLLQEGSHPYEPVPFTGHNEEDGEEDMPGEQLQWAAQLPSPHGAWQGNCQHVHGTG